MTKAIPGLGTMRSVAALLPALLASSVLSSCGAQSAPEPAPDCTPRQPPGPSRSCGAGCAELRGAPLDRDHSCAEDSQWVLRCVDAAGTHVWPAAVTCYQRDDIVVFANAIYDPLISQGWQRCDPELAYPGPCAATDADAGSGHDAGPVRDAGSVDDSP